MICQTEWVRGTEICQSVSPPTAQTLRKYPVTRHPAHKHKHPHTVDAQEAFPKLTDVAPWKTFKTVILTFICSCCASKVQLTYSKILGLWMHSKIHWKFYKVRIVCHQNLIPKAGKSHCIPKHSRSVQRVLLPFSSDSSDYQEDSKIILLSYCS